MNAQGYFKIDDLDRVQVTLTRVVENGEEVSPFSCVFQEVTGLLERHVEANESWLFHQYGHEGRIELNDRHVTVGRVQ